MKERKMRTRRRGNYAQWVSRVPEGHGVANQEGDRGTVAAYKHKHVILEVPLPAIPLVVPTDELSIILLGAHLIKAQA